VVGGATKCGRLGGVSAGRLIIRNQARYLKKNVLMAGDKTCVLGVLQLMLREMTVLTMQQTSTMTVKMRYLANSGRLSDDGGSRFVTSTCK